METVTLQFISKTAAKAGVDLLLTQGLLALVEVKMPNGKMALIQPADPNATFDNVFGAWKDHTENGDEIRENAWRGFTWP
jgi:hypothetical protein